MTAPLLPAFGRALASHGPAPTPEPPETAPETLPRVLVTGSRHLAADRPVRAALTATWRELGRPFVLVHGACQDREGNLLGADRWADEWAVEHALHGIVVERHPADWARHGHRGGPLRNAYMVGLGAVRCLAFPLGLSPGTRDCVKRARGAGIPVTVHEGRKAADYSPRNPEPIPTHHRHPERPSAGRTQAKEGPS